MIFELSEVARASRGASFEIRTGEPYRSRQPHRLFLDGRQVFETQLNVFTLTGLRPGIEYRLEVESGARRTEMSFRTETESGCVDVRDFGAVGDGRKDNTAALQSAIDACPENGAVEIPAGDWLTAPLFLKSCIRLQLAPGARIVGSPDIDRWPVLPAFDAQAGGDPLVLGSWEGEPADCHAGLITGIGVQGVRICGGCIDANASFETWWSRPKQPFGGWRPRTVYLVRARDVAVLDTRFRNSPSWTVHALECSGLRLANLEIEAPADSPNTDGINPESCEDVRIAGACISTGDDCIGIKSGKRGRHARAFKPTRGVTITNCLMEKGHGAVVIGSEMSGGVYDVLVRECIFRGTDRGLRIKTRRGRGSTAIVSGIRLENVRMEAVGTPFVVNSFYWCDPDGRTPYVGDRRPHPVDEGTPLIRDISLEGVQCTDVHQCAGYVLALPERPLENLHVRDYTVRFAQNAVAGEPDMAEGIQPVARGGFYLCNVRGARLEALHLEGVEGDDVIGENVT